MASFRERIAGRWTVDIRKKNCSMQATFSDRETAELWAKYKEDIVDEIENFSPPTDELFTLSNAIDLKARSLKEKEAAHKTIDDTLKLKVYFDKFSDKSLSDISLEDYSEHCKMMLNMIVQRGGSLNKGKPVQQSPATVYKKFRYLSIVYSFMQEQGVKIVNHPQAILRELEKKMGKGLEC